MKQLRLLLAVTMTTVLLLTALATSSVKAAPLHSTFTCSATNLSATLTGSYDFLSSPTVTISQGTVIAIPDSIFALSPVPYAARGTISFDGRGQVWIEEIGQSGQEAAAATRFGAIYAVDGCTLMVEFENGTQLGVRMVVTERARFPVSTTPGFVILRSPESLTYR
jgi:hypothetical protein